MSRYIDADLLIRELIMDSKDNTAYRREYEHQDAYININGLINYIKSLPTANVTEVKHGEWKECFEDWRKQIIGDECSVCGFRHYGASINYYHYCPNCGAKMDYKE